MTPLLTDLYMVFTLIAAAVVAGICLYLWFIYGRYPATRRFFICIVSIFALTAIGGVGAYIRSYGASPDCFQEGHAIAGVVTRGVQAFGTLLIFGIMLRGKQ